MGQNISFFGVLIRLMACMFFGILAGFTGLFFFYLISVLTLVVALSGYDPLVHMLKGKSAQSEPYI